MITVTPTAQDRLLEILDIETSGANTVRVSVVRGPHGCVHGWSLAVADDQGPEDVVESFGKLNVIVESGLTASLAGASIDYREGAEGIGFAIDAPNASDHGNGGGCGHHHD